MKNLLFAIALITFTATSCKSSKDVVNDDAPMEENRSNKSKRGKGGDVTEMFTKFDTNKDGQLSMSEVKGPLAKDFEKIDTDGNGFISLSEMKKAPKPQRGQRGQDRPGRN